MRLSVPLVEEGAFIGVAAQGDAGWFFIAVDARLEELDRQNFPSVTEVERVARGYLRRHHPAATAAWT